MKQRQLLYKDLLPESIWCYPGGKTKHIVLVSGRSRCLDNPKITYSVPPKQPIVLAEVI